MTASLLPRDSSLLQAPGKPWLTNAALLLFGLLLLIFCRAGVGEFHHYTYGFGADVFSQLILYLGAIALIERGPVNKATLSIIFAMALLARLVCVFAPAFLSTDVYRYVWDGQVQAAGINPFRYIPADIHLNWLRDSAIYPHINRRSYAHTIYPPGAQFIFLAITRISATEPFMKLAMVGFEAATCFILLKTMALLRLPRERILLYAWHPLCFWEIASSGHVDAAALTFIALALYTTLRHKTLQSGFWLGAATLVKMYPLVLLPALLAFPLRKRAWQLTTAALSTILLGYACYASVGKGVFGFLPVYAQEEGLATGIRYFPLALVNRTLHTAIPSLAYVLFCALIMGTLCVWALRRNKLPQACIFSSLVIATTLNLCYSPHYPWYFLWLLPALTLLPWRPAFYLVLAATYLFATDLGAPSRLYLLNTFLYGGFFFLLALDAALRYLSLPLHSKQPLHSSTRPGALTNQFVNARDL